MVHLLIAVATIYTIQMGSTCTHERYVRTYQALERALWGDFTLQPKTKRLVRIKAADVGKLKPLFAQLVLEPIWKVCSQ